MYKERELIDRFLKTDDPDKTAEPSSVKRLDQTKQCIRELCESLGIECQHYKPDTTVDIVNNYIKNEKVLNRLLYSEISSYVFSLSEDKRANIDTNIDNLLNYTFKENMSLSDECCNFITKLYDHVQLGIKQLENVKNVLSLGIEDSKEQLLVETKKIEREYIAILGIFAAIVLAFVGGLTFSSSVLQYMSQVSIYRISLIALIIGFVFINLIYGLFYYIDKIVKTKNDKKLHPLFITNIIIVILIACTLFAWWRGLVEHRNLNIENNMQKESIISIDENKPPAIWNVSNP